MPLGTRHDACAAGSDPSADTRQTKRRDVTAAWAARGSKTNLTGRRAACAKSERKQRGGVTSRWVCQLISANNPHPPTNGAGALRHTWRSGG
jgi:hypothetical protein